jgi:hypothetical protein
MSRTHCGKLSAPERKAAKPLKRIVLPRQRPDLVFVSLLRLLPPCSLMQIEVKPIPEKEMIVADPLMRLDWRCLANGN